MTAEQALLGTWTLFSFVVDREDGTSFMPYGPHPLGILHYAPDGQMLVHLTDPAPGETPRMAFPSFIFYAGRYRIDGDQVVHDLTVSALHPPAGARVVRRFELDGDRLTLFVPPATSLAANARSVRLVWQRAAQPEQGAPR